MSLRDGGHMERVTDKVRHFYRQQPPFDTGELPRPRLGISEREVRNQLRPRTGLIDASPRRASAVQAASPTTRKD
jgi:hypothetical protein